MTMLHTALFSLQEFFIEASIRSPFYAGLTLLTLTFYIVSNPMGNQSDSLPQQLPQSSGHAAQHGIGKLDLFGEQLYKMLAP